MAFGDLEAKVGLTLLRQGVPIMGEREARLLGAVARVQSIKDAAREAGISYRTAWGAIQMMERAWGRPVVESRAGGPGGGATTLTAECRDLLRLYQELVRRLDEHVQQAFHAAEQSTAV